MEAYIISLVLILLSATFSGLTLGYFSLNTQTLRRKAGLGSQDAKLILPIREHSNRLLTTLLLGNVAVNAVLSVYLSSIATGLVAVIIATVLIFLFGEIIPQAAFARHAMYVGSRAAPFVKVLMFLTYPITWPITFFLNKILGTEIHSLYSKRELMAIVSELEDSENSPLDEDEERIIHGALQFSHTTVREVMTPKERVFTYDINVRLTDDLTDDISEHNFSRYPVYSGNPDNIVGILFTKDLLSEETGTALKDTKEAVESNFLTIKPNTHLDIVLGIMLKKHKHMAIVKNKSDNFLGVITLEDIIEEIIQFEIEDEDDVN
ncbi:DUF21 domain-containing protein [Candidatus Kaiserbacteria bacterium]|nr:DUF21 domain-containing protein [Candidatus Kaiserbacteria bacterium]